MESNYRIFFAHGDDKTRPIITEMLKALDQRVELDTNSGRELIAAVEQNPPDLLISGVRLADMDGIDALIECGRRDPLPSIVIASKMDQEKVEHALEDHVMAYLVEPVHRADLRPAIFLVMRRFAEFEELRQENEQLKQALAERKLVERAKGLLMKKRGFDEQQAYQQLRRIANDRRRRLGEVAKTLVEADQFLDDLPSGE